jgi:hypothetical protein
MDTQVVISVLLSVIGFLLAAIFYQLQRVGRNVEQLMINEAAHKTQIEDLERRITNIESHHNGIAYGKR